MYPPIGLKIRTNGSVKVKEEGKTHITEEFRIRCPQQLKYLIQNLEIEDEELLTEAVSGIEPITVVSDGGIKQGGGFGWIATLDEEIIAT